MSETVVKKSTQLNMLSSNQDSRANQEEIGDKLAPFGKTFPKFYDNTQDTQD